MKKNRLVRRGLLIVAAIALCSFYVRAQTVKTLVACVAPTGDKCLCQADKKTEGCECADCVPGEACSCVARLKSQTGVVTGVVKDKWAKRFPTLVYVEEIKGATFPPPKKPDSYDQKGKEFIPHVLTVLQNATVDFLNNDDFEHNVFSPDGEKYNLGKWGKGKIKSYTFKNRGVYVQLCLIHPEMVGYIVVLQNPYFTFADNTGKFTLRNVPPGKWQVRAWNERMKPKNAKKLFEVTVEQGKETTVELIW